jgi:hypothetical protein
MFTSQCPACGLGKSEWVVNKGEGYSYDEMTYCCRGCAEDVGCSCQTEGALSADRRTHYRRNER